MKEKVSNIEPRERFGSLVDILERRAALSPFRLAYKFTGNRTDETTEINYGDLYRRASKVAAELQDKNLTGASAILLYHPSIDYIIGYLGCLMSGVIAIPVAIPNYKKINSQLNRIISDSCAKLLLTTNGIAGELSEIVQTDLFARQVEIIVTCTLSTSNEKRYRSYHPGGNDTAFLQYTSGSTSAPKGVMVSHFNLINNLQSIKEKFRHSSESVGVIWLPPYHDMGLIGGILQPLYTGFPVILMSPFAMIQNPLRWLQAISDYRATTSGGPDFSFALCTRKIREEDCENLDLSSWKAAFCGGEFVRKETLEAFARKFENYGFCKSAFLPTYGLAEATLIVSGSDLLEGPSYLEVDSHQLIDGKAEPPRREAGNAKTLVGSGKVVNGTRVVITDPHTLTEKEDKYIGEIWVSGPGVAKGYINNTGDSRFAFDGTLSSHPGMKFLRTGDLGFICNEELFITGRLKDLMIIRGGNYYPQDIEWTIAESHALLSVNSGAVFSLDDGKAERLVIVQELIRGYGTEHLEDVLVSIQASVSREHGLKADAIILIAPFSIQKTTSGKICRQACKEAFLHNELAVIKQKGSLTHLQNQ